ncbi:tyrosine-protein phosphatase [Paenibacillus thalictri]|uniref:Tyrosine-protein phosphatase n=1 Tax=Paenibacillus thalictri TaxID=2527873 RepID=A0A4Q9DGB2_9BACL|nr:CpsB/CapC family capsule biosynthesis tyrosine phosphatase [Paenibacillus thalictri]TBL71182.1 hypothetical protein EYB31_30860 [Paenibacillus thalictri]
MIDIHCHILHHIDDGASDLNESLDMARIAYNDGVRDIIVTPHFNQGWRSTRALVDERLQELQAAIHQAGIGITLHRGNELTLESAEFFHEHNQLQHFHYLAGKPSFLLVEMPWSGYNEAAPDIVRHLRDQGATPILAHPERHIFFRERPELLDNLLEAGIWTQVTVDSLLGKNGEDARLFGLRLLDQGQVHTIATDAHNVKRKPNLSEGYRIIAERQGQAAADAIQDRIKQILAG